MKKTLPFLGAGFLFLSFLSCQRNAHQDIISVNAISAKPSTTAATATAKPPSNPGACNSHAYTVTLENRTQLGDGNWEWIWSVQNPNPGNGNNGTVQNLSHWGMQFGSCFNWSDVVSAAYSSNGSSWTGFVPSLQVDPSQGCMTTPVMKFNYGTTGSNKTFYKLVVAHSYDVTMVPGYYKSGANTGCCTFEFPGIGCSNGDDDDTNPR